MKIKFKKDQIKSLINLYIRIIEEGYKIEYWACQKEKYNIAQNESNMTIFYEVNLIY